MKKFTDLLDDYLEADKDYKEAKACHSGYDFDYFHYEICDRLRKATDALNAAFEQATKGEL